jgi:hypothetical protein
VERPIQINWKDPNKRVEALVYNNTCLTSNPQQVKSIWNGFAEPNPGTVVRNNISLGGVRFGAGSIVSHNIDADNALFVNPNATDMAARDYALRPTAAAAIDKGVSVPPWEGGMVGVPDIGAYEFGAPRWKAGASAYEAVLAKISRAAQLAPQVASRPATTRPVATAAKTTKSATTGGTQKKAAPVARPAAKSSNKR